MPLYEQSLRTHKLAHRGNGQPTAACYEGTSTINSALGGVYDGVSTEHAAIAGVHVGARVFQGL